MLWVVGMDVVSGWYGCCELWVWMWCESDICAVGCGYVCGMGVVWVVWVVGLDVV